MDYRIRVRTGVKNESVTVARDGRLLVCVSAKPKQGEANDRVCVLVAKYLGLLTKDVKIVRGQSTPTKVIRTKE
jgi:uncharacterized protein